MVHFILGSAGSGKSRTVLERVGEQARQGIKTYLFVPEQFTFETERKYYSLLGARVFQHVQVLSFSRLAHQIFKEFGGVAGDYADDSVKLILMNLALESVRPHLGVYQRTVKNISFSKNMVELVEELKNADLTAEDFSGRVRRLEEGMLKSKSKDISLIFETYDAFLSAGYKDALDDITRACKKIQEQDYFRDSAVFVDEFKGFTAKEFQMIRLMIKQAGHMTFTLCTDHRDRGTNSLFYSVNTTYEDLKRLVREEGGKISAPTVLETNYRFQCPELAHLAEYVFRGHLEPYQGENTHIQAVLAANEYDEVDYALSTVRSLVESGAYRYREIVLITRDLDSYRSCLETAFEKYQVPYYMDSLKSIASSPLIRFIELAFQCITKSFSSDQIISLLKCGVTPFDFTDIARLENYAYLWNLKKKNWSTQFTFSIYGVNPPKGEEQEREQAEVLTRLNQIRETVIRALNRFKRASADTNGRGVSMALIRFLNDLGVRQKLDELIGQTEGDSLAEELVQSGEYKKVWEIVGQMINILASTLGKRPLSAERYGELFSLVAANFDMGTIPQTLDSVTVGSAERIRTDAPKVVMILGVNDKVFPLIPDNSGIYTDLERGKLIELGLELSKPVKERIKEEKFIAYKAMATPSELLYLTARKADVKGTAMAVSYLYPQLKRLFGDEVIMDTEDLDRLYFCRTSQTAFSVLAYQFRQDTTLTASLKSYFSALPAYAEKMETIANSITRGRFRLTDPKLASDLFGRQVTMSPTKVEQYHRCKFRYFCEQGLGLKKREKIQLNAVNKGNMVHDILYRVCTKITDFSTFDEKLICELIQQAVDEFIKNLGGYDNQTQRFLYLYQRVQKSVLVLLKRLFEELAHSKFRPQDFEYTIGAQGNIRPFTFVSEDGITIHIQGTIDRVDAYSDESGEKYIRVIDYKTGTKEFKLADIINGLNLQMFLYLLCLQKNGAGSYRDAIGAGALYMPAGDLTASLGRDATEDDTQKTVQAHYQMKGIILNRDQVVTAMEPDLQGIYTPISVKAKAFDGEKQLVNDVFVEHQANEALFSSQSLEMLLTSQQIDQLFSSIEQSVSTMVRELYGGNIEAKPLVGKRVNGCDFCNFKTVCRFEENDPVTEYLDLKKKELFDYLKQQNGKEEQDG